MTISDASRIVVLEAVCRGMGFAYAARAASVTVATVRDVAEKAGHPDVDAVRGELAALRERVASRRLLLLEVREAVTGEAVARVQAAGQRVQLPQGCEVCAVPVTGEYIRDHGGRARHGWHRADAS